MNKDQFKSNVRHYIKVHKELHGGDVFTEKSKKEIAEDLYGSFSYNIKDSMKEINSIQEQVELNKIQETSKPIEYGVFIGRMQPFHLGHQAVVNEIILDGKKPILVLGSSNKQDDKNPLSFTERKELIELVYPNKEVLILSANDYNNWDTWMEELGITLIGSSGRHQDNLTFYINNKECDRLDFTYRGKEYKNEFYTKLFEIEGLKTKIVEFVNRKDFKIDSNARDIRHDIEGFKHFLDARIYWNLKAKGW